MRSYSLGRVYNFRQFLIPQTTQIKKVTKGRTKLKKNQYYIYKHLPLTQNQKQQYQQQQQYTVQQLYNNFGIFLQQFYCYYYNNIKLQQNNNSENNNYYNL
eukprot:TRINITY_DN3197_c0_g1_i10.p22 TRINITY_DN3197_c0_g1~~TRINITY_DN3197_c0_g1_i10.p22  ORF type:complete len:101 (+),score=5.11 TRINITY_DN3197_c0_g1_i10:2020-2322(+)